MTIDTRDLAGTAQVDGEPASVMDAVAAAAALLGRSRAPVVAGLGTDVAGARACIQLAITIGASIDHAASDAVFADLDVMRTAGWIVTTPLQTRARADTVLLVGGGHAAAWPDMIARLALTAPPSLVPDAVRRVYHLCPGADAASQGAREISGLQSGLLPTLAALRAIAKGRNTELPSHEAIPLHDLASELKAARFGVAIWSGTHIETLAIEMLVGLIDDLNRSTRFAGLPLAASDDGEAVSQVVAWLTGCPVRTGFAAVAPRHDPWRFDARRLIASGEADAALWVSATSPVPPPWADAVPTVAVVSDGTVFRKTPAVVIHVGRPGLDHDALLFHRSLGGIASVAATSPRPLAHVADIVAAISHALSQC